MGELLKNGPGEREVFFERIAVRRLEFATEEHVVSHEAQCGVAELVGDVQGIGEPRLPFDQRRRDDDRAGSSDERVRDRFVIPSGSGQTDSFCSQAEPLFERRRVYLLGGR